MLRLLPSRIGGPFQKPVGRPRLDLSRAPRGLQRCLPFADPAWRDLVSDRAPSKAGAPVLVASAGGHGASSGGSASNFLSLAVDVPTRLSLEAVFVTGSTAPTSQAILGWSNNSTASSGVDDREIYIDSSGKLVFRIFDGASKAAVSSDTTAANTRYHVVAVSDGTNIYLYVNGALKATTAAGNAYSGYTTPFLTLLKNEVVTGSIGGPLLLVNYANVAWSAEEVADRFADPFGFLDYPEDDLLSTLVGVAAAGGGTAFSDSIALTASATFSAAGAVRMSGAVTLSGSTDTSAAALATFTDGITAAATAGAGLDASAAFADAVTLAGSSALSASAGATAFSEAIGIAASPAFAADGALRISGTIALGASAGASAAGSLSIGETVAFAATLSASAAATLTMREAIAAAATAALALAASSSADNVIVRTVGLSGRRDLVFTLDGRRNRVINLRGSLSN